MKVLVVGGGGREHALTWSLANDPAVEEVSCAPGNAGIAQVAKCVEIEPGDVPGLLVHAEAERIDLTVVGPEAPLVDGLADEMRSRGLRVFGPGAAGARMEGSKSWAREFCERHGIPQPWSRAFADLDDALAFVRGYEGPYVVKADGLAAGKGVTVTPDRVEAEAALTACLSEKAFGEAGETVVVEECMTGPEISALALADGETILPLDLAQDHKRVGDGDTGPNTGGMGAYSPLAWVDPSMRERIVEEILGPVTRALAAESIPYRGVLYAGLMLTDEGPKVLEFNCRFGDPETQALLPRVRSGLVDALVACADGRLAEATLDWREEACLTVTLASGGYPGEYPTGVPIHGLGEAGAVEGVTVFHAGTALKDDRVVTSGGRVLSVSALGGSLAEARERAYEACSRIRFEGMHFRRDIAAIGGSD